MKLSDVGRKKLMAKNVTHDFYCIHCGQRGIPISRQVGKLREKDHIKNLYCIYCKKATRHLEVYNDIEAKEFKENFIKGVYMDDAKGDQASCGVSRIWKEFLG